MKNTLVILFASLTLLAGCNKPDETSKSDKSQSEDIKTAEVGETGDAEPDGEIIATVNGMGIPAARLNVYSQPGQNPQDVINNIISSELIEQEARRLKIHEQDTIAQQLRVAEQTVLGRAYTQKFISENPVSSEKIDERYEEFKTEYEGREEILAAHILVSDEELANKIQSEVSADGEKFAELAGEHSKDPGSGAAGGVLGWADPRDFVPEFSEAIISTEAGNLVGAPVKTQFGWHIIRVDEKRVLPLPELNEEMRRNITQAEQAQMFSKHLNELREKAEIQINIPTP